MTLPDQTALDLSDSLPISREQVESALALAALDAIRENQRFGLPVISWEDGKIVYVDPFVAEKRLLDAHPELFAQQKR